jgi:hypothetical protein
MAICEGLSSCIAHRLRCVLRITNRLHLIVLRSRVGCRVTNDSRISGSASYEPSPVYADSQRVEYLEGQRVCRKRAPFIVATEKYKVAGTV